ncbi:uncharacterized protein LTR77_010066 [Saxophila tyrrhenica]|uniref:RING-type domain-containing protein n=1 Tax=Saxophila tyrrhenica TaxID=1690608 RepID=A0AAV9P0M2_9PEZI|nr:hypothetical protein LTR77_010066 [Saxophila tyrrhenica]
MSQPPGIASKAAASSSKAPPPSGQSSPAASVTQQFFSNDSGQRRSGSGSGNARSNAAPRNVQNSKAKHKAGKKFRALDEDAEAELFSMQNPHGRKGQTSITHLMNFSLPPRPNQQQQYHRHSYNGPRRGGRSNPTWGLGSGYHSVDKARYIHANYRFIVDPRGDYQVQAEDADVHLDWQNVLQIIASEKSQAASCPICLGDPTAPRMAKCGHIFCMPCLIRYMHSDDGNGPPPEKKARWKKCPICWDSIYVSETRPVRWYVGQESDPPREGGDVVLRLLRRRPGQTLAMPRESAETVPKGDFIPWYFAAEVMDYARVMRGSEDYMVQQYDEAIEAIEMLQKEDELMFGEDAEWTGRAIRMLNEAKAKVKGIGNPPEQPKKPEQEMTVPERPPIEFREDDEDVPDWYLQKHTETSPAIPRMEATEQPNAQTPANVSAVPRTLQEMRQRQFEKPQPAEYLFYQALLHYYLSPLDIRILKAAFGSYTTFPSSILPRVERVSSGHIVDDDLRKRVKYLAHLPYGCEVGFLECDWTDLVPPHILAEFKPMLERRRKRHDEKEAREEKDRIRIERAEERELAAIRRKRPSVPSDFMSGEGLPALGSMAGSEPTSDAIATSPPWANRTTSGFTSLASPSTSPTAHRTVWGTAAVTPASPDLNATLPRDDELRPDQDDGWLQDWERDLLDQRDQLADDVGGVSLETETQARAPVGGGKKGKKGKKITLMSTATSRRGA